MCVWGGRAIMQMRSRVVGAALLPGVVCRRATHIQGLVLVVPVRTGVPADREMGSPLPSANTALYPASSELSVAYCRVDWGGGGAG